MYAQNIIERYNLYKKIIIYLRKSREEMINGYGSVEITLERHEEILQTWAVQNLGAKIPEENIYREVGSGETISERPVMVEIMKMFKSNEIAAVLIVEPQRLSRGELKDCGELIETLEHTDTKVLTPQKIYDLTDKYDKKMFRDELLRGNEYLEYTKEILARGRHLSVSQGKFVGSRPPFGFDKEKLTGTKGFKLAPNSDANTVKLIFSMFIEGNTPFQIATHLRAIEAKARGEVEWEHGAVKDILINPVYYGYQTWENRKTTKMFIDGKIKTVRVKNPEVKLYKGLHDPIISEEDYFKVQDIIKNRSTPRTNSSHETQNPLAGIVRCGVCGRSMVRQVHSGQYITKRKYDFDKIEFQKFLKEHKDKNKITHKEIYTALNIPKYYVYDWFGKPEKFYPAEKFIDNWGKLKEILKIKTNKYDNPLTEFIQVPKPDTLACIYHNCSNTSSHLHLVEDMIQKVIAVRLENYKKYLDNYEFEYIKELEDNEKIIKKIDKEIASINKQLKNALRTYNAEDCTREEYLEIKEELKEELEVLEKKKSSLSVNKEEKIIVIKRAVPILSNCIEKYPDLQPKDKNKLLKSLLYEVYYTKPEKGADFDIKPKFKI
jgi:hypothetical protein